MLECIDAIEVYCGSEDIASDERTLDARHFESSNS